MYWPRFYKIILLLFMMVGAGSVTAEINDPLEPLNRGIFYFNQMATALYIKPVARTYDVVVPLPAKESVHNFISNVRTVHFTANNLLQGKIGPALNNVACFVINSTLGIFGLFDVTSALGMTVYPERLGNTFYKWGWKNSSYFVIPIIGPSTIRDGISLIGDYFMSPPAYFEPKWRNIYYAVDLIDIYQNNQDLQSVVIIAGVNDYDFVRTSYMQYREYTLSGKVVPTADSSGNDMLGEPPA